MLRYIRPRYLHNPNHYLVPQQRIPGYLPYPHELGPGNIPVPNASGVDWPQAQFAPAFFPPGHKSFQDYRYPDYRDDTVLGGLAGADDAQHNPSVTLDLAQVGLLLGAGLLGYMTAKHGWDRKIRAKLKSAL